MSTKTSITSYDSDIGKKANTKLARRLQELITDSPALAKYLGCSLQAINQYKQGTAFPKVENLIRIADYYNISVDYLVGVTDTKNRDTTIQAVCEYTGLSEENAQFLNKMRQFDSTRFANAINFLLDDSRIGDSTTRSALTLMHYFLEYSGEEMLPTKIDTQGRMSEYQSSFIPSNSIVLNGRIIENAVLDELKQHLIALKGERQNGKHKNDADKGRQEVL